MGAGMTEATADACLAAWAEQAARDGIERGAAYWDGAWEWIAAQQARRVRPSSTSVAAPRSFTRAGRLSMSVTVRPLLPRCYQQQNENRPEGRLCV